MRKIGRGGEDLDGRSGEPVASEAMQHITEHGRCLMQKACQLHRRYLIEGPRAELTDCDRILAGQAVGASLHTDCASGLSAIRMPFRTA